MRMKVCIRVRRSMAALLMRQAYIKCSTHASSHAADRRSDWRPVPRLRRFQRMKSSSHADPLPPALVLLLAAGAGFSVAALYYAQPMLGLLADQFGAASTAIGLVPTLTQLGYA